MLSPKIKTLRASMSNILAIKCWGQMNKIIIFIPSTKPRDTIKICKEPKRVQLLRTKDIPFKRMALTNLAKSFAWLALASILLWSSATRITCTSTCQIRLTHRHLNLYNRTRCCHQFDQSILPQCRISEATQTNRDFFRQRKFHIYQSMTSSKRLWLTSKVTWSHQSCPTRGTRFQCCTLLTKIEQKTVTVLK